MEGRDAAGLTLTSHLPLVAWSLKFAAPVYDTEYFRVRMVTIVMVWSSGSCSTL